MIKGVGCIEKGLGVVDLFGSGVGTRRWLLPS